MDLQIRLSDTPDHHQHDQEQRSLFNWLRSDRELRAGTETSMVADTSVPGGMGIAFEAVQLIVDSAFQLGNLAIAIAAWRKAYEPRSEVTIEYNGVKVTLPQAGPDDVQAILNRLERLTDTAAPDPADPPPDPGRPGEGRTNPDDGPQAGPEADPQAGPDDGPEDPNR